MTRIPARARGALLTPDMRAVVEAAHLCFAATVRADGRPSVSPKGTIRVWDRRHLFYLDIASPGTSANLARSPFIELNVVEQLSRRGYRFAGRGTVHRSGPVYDQATARVFAEEGTSYPVDAIVLVAVESATPLVSPGYWVVEDEREMRRIWRRRRSALDRAFEAWLATRKPVRATRPRKG